MVITMHIIALVTDAESINNDFDMPLLIKACEQLDIKTDIVRWDDLSINWSKYSLVILRSPWSYVDRLNDFIKWCKDVDKKTTLLNPLQVISWGLNKKYLLDLKAKGVGIVTTSLIDRKEKNVTFCVSSFIKNNIMDHKIVIKPSIGAYSRGVKIFSKNEQEEIVSYINELHSSGNDALMQPYLTSINSHGETDLVYFDGNYSHSIRKNALLQPDGSVCEPLQEHRKARNASMAELQVAELALKAVTDLFSLEMSLLYARVDLVLDDSGKPVILEMEISEPSLNLPFAEGSALRLAEAIRKRLLTK